jgi:hypothetical protein
LSNDKAEIDLFISNLRTFGASLIGTMKIVKEKLNLSLAEAQDITLISTAWNDHKEFFYDFNGRMLDALNDDKEESGK